jgi:nucleoside-diphosphate-sugar epimerase
MVIGSGMLANRFSNYKADNEKIIFASGVSNSKNIIEENFKRELDLLEQTTQSYPYKTFIYFSTTSIGDADLSNSPYIAHKIAIENFIKKNTSDFLIFRVSNIAGVSNNPFTLLNYFIFNILQNNVFTLWKNAYRNIIGIDDMYSIVDFILKGELFLNTVINIANPKNYSVPFIISEIEKYFNKKANFITTDRGNNFSTDVSLIKPIIRKLKIQFNEDYLTSLLQKYYHSR